MEEILLEAKGKINLGLDVLRKREDGYHEVDMIMQSVSLKDTLRLRKIPENKIVLQSADGGEIPYVPLDETNLIYKVIQGLREEFQLPGGVEATLTKVIPVAAGMAGGSTDAAAAFRGMNALYDLNLSEEALCARGVKYGADIPYCIKGGTARSEGIGEILTPLPDMPACYILIAKPQIQVSTGFVYGNLRANELKEHPDIPGMCEAIGAGDLEGVIRRLGNVLETVTIPAYPIIAEIKEMMCRHGAKGALMSGSGPTVFGIYTDESYAKEAAEQIAREKLAGQIYVVTPC